MKYLITLFLVTGVIIGGFLYYKSSLVSEIDSFESCVKAGNPVLESYPRQCRTSDGRSFVEEILEHPMIRVTSLKPGDVISSPLVVTGEARGTWYFEASFPVHLVDGHNTTIATGIAQAQSDWMTEDFVPFKAELIFTPSDVDEALLVLQKDNPSGLPEFDDNLIIPITFAKSMEVSICRRAGCNSEVCSDGDVISTCEFKEEYACYAKARCERQTDGQCGWTETSEFMACISDLKK